MAKTSRIKIKLSKDAIKSLKSEEAVKAELRKQADKIARAANATIKQKQKYPDYDVVETDEVVRVVTRSNHAKYSNAKKQTLVRVRKM
jgi:HSP20 family molecular chaperone IbpA